MELPEHADAAVRRFLQSVMVVDDRAHYGLESEAATLVVPEHVTAVQADDAEDQLAEPTEPSKSLLDAKELIDAFAAEGLVCGVMRPDPPVEPETRLVLAAASRADIVVLDWHLDDAGEHARAILSALSDQPGLRLAAVYTYDDSLEQIAVQIADDLGGSVSGEFRVVAKDFVVEVYAKESAVLSGPAATRVKTPVDLAHQLIADFARMTQGIVPTAAVAAIGALRRETPRVLGLLGAELDPGYLGHRILLPDPFDSSRQLLDLIGAELRTVIDDDKIVNDSVSQQAIECHVRALLPFAAQLPADIVCRALEIGTATPAAKEELQRHAEVSEMPENKRLGARKPSQTLHFTGGDEAKAHAADLLFGVRMSLRTDTETPPYLQLGTIVIADGEWLVCVQPDCDSVRLDAAREFPFLRATQVDVTARFDAIVELDGVRKGLQIDKHLYSMKQVAFAPDGTTRTVIAAKGEGFWSFSSVNAGDFRYVAQFKRDHSRRLSHEFAQTGSRIGLDESELFRRWGERKG